MKRRCSECEKIKKVRYREMWDMVSRIAELVDLICECNEHLPFKEDDDGDDKE